MVFALLLAIHNASFAAPSPAFFWGVASSSFQVEGHPADSDWRRWTQTPGKIKDASNANVVTDFWNRYDEDFKLTQNLGANAYRMSLAWERIEPQSGAINPRALEHYGKMILAMRKRGLEPIVTLQHFALPGWLADRGGLLSVNFAQDFAYYAGEAFSFLAKKPYSVRYWMTVNEPNVLALGSYQGGPFPPGLNNGLLASRAQAALAKAHILGVIRMRALAAENAKLVSPKISIALNWVHMEPKNNYPQDRFIAALGQKFYNEQFVNSIVSGKIEFGHVLVGGKVSERVELPEGYVGLDYLGLNYYFRNQVYAMPKAPFFGNGPGPGPKTEMGWEIYPQGLEAALKKAYANWKLPILISENGIADSSDHQRPEYLTNHLTAMNRAIAAGVPVMGYLHWSLTDNFEWAEGLSQRFGLVEVNYSTLKKTPRSSYWVYKNWIARSKRP